MQVFSSSHGDRREKGGSLLRCLPLGEESEFYNFLETGVIENSPNPNGT